MNFPPQMPQKRKEPPNPSSSKPNKKVKRVGPRSESRDNMPNGNGDKDAEASKPKRVRTGCLTCRERHLKCDEATPNCNNCKKSNRVCRRGVRLNFIDTWVDRPPTIITLYGTQDWKVEFLDESREIASEYRGGAKRYKRLRQDVGTNALDSAVAFEFPADDAQVAAMAQPLPSIHGLMPDAYQQPSSHQPSMSNIFDVQAKPDPNQFQQQAPPPQPSSAQQSQYAESGMKAMQGSVASYPSLDTDLPEHENQKKEYLDSQEETLFMQVFVEEVGLWMDSMDSQKHFSRLLPFHSLSEPMLLNAFLACGARHLTLVNPAYTEEKALNYYDTATRHLLRNLQNPNRDTVICATTAVILNVYEIMSERALQRMNHIAGARALIKECGWNARAQGIGSACFWLNVGLEVLSCLHFNWQVAWDPDEWGVDLDFSRELHNGREEVWTHRMLYIVAKVCNFRATMPRYPEMNQRDEQVRSQQRHEEWGRLKSLCDAWNDGIPRTMHPMAYLNAFQTSSKSVFPEIWLVKRSTIVARLFYHTAMLLMSQIHPYYHVHNNPEMADMQTRHAQMVCGIVAHVKDRGVASVAIRSLAHAAEVLTDRKEQDEVLQIFEKINKETGWRIGFVYKELKEKWGWNEEPSPQQFAQTHTAHRQAKEAQEAQQRQMQEQAHRQSLQLQQGFDFNQQQSMATGLPQQTTPNPHMQHTPPIPSQQTPQPQQNKRPPSGIPNPMFSKADFNLPQHPYQNFYVPPNNVGFGNPTQGGPLQGGPLYYNP
ncbi:hypothetical protein PRZ48_013964 [Zasmidium cellare]|uniref:Zn(2)-C6 fungal-type domain-containing protein n=1 Tax=Zasmidium cellare TaxID=395010 RepID=A0ABR0E0C1_ZASCE|nr:hypothetical protein PRZ48_013964 [Zasmidium cellare]